ncbi:BrnT family toxin [Methylobacterium sp. 10]|uniref:BrnT family toxin n=1 Tax=Methylobacterium sp. 10 TaxID=1101191 RepID=UPI0004808F2E|nr:BrnT family toxin [Methylobacterium sp. 10]
MAITFHPAKRDKALAERAMDFAAAAAVFAGPCFSFEDNRADYGETRIITIGLLAGRMVVIGWTPRGDDQHVFSMRKANDREQKKYAPLLR